jgi:hypothetical protein
MSGVRQTKKEDQERGRAALVAPQLEHRAIGARPSKGDHSASPVPVFLLCARPLSLPAFCSAVFCSALCFVLRPLFISRRRQQQARQGKHRGEAKQQAGRRREGASRS